MILWIGWSPLLARVSLVGSCWTFWWTVASWWVGDLGFLTYLVLGRLSARCVSFSHPSACQHWLFTRLFSGFQAQHRLLLVSHFLLFHLPRQAPWPGTEPVQEGTIQKMDAEGYKQIGTIPKKSSTSIFRLPFGSALLWYVLLAFSLELQNPPSSTCSSFLSKYALCPISYHTNCRCDFEWIYQKIKLQWIFHPSRNTWQTINNSLISPRSSVILAASHWKKGHSYKTLEMILIKMSNTSD